MLLYNRSHILTAVHKTSAIITLCKGTKTHSELECTAHINATHTHTHTCDGSTPSSGAIFLNAFQWKIWASYNLSVSTGRHSFLLLVFPSCMISLFSLLLPVSRYISDWNKSSYNCRQYYIKTNGPFLPLDKEFLDVDSDKAF